MGNTGAKACVCCASAFTPVHTAQKSTFDLELMTKLASQHGG